MSDTVTFQLNGTDVTVPQGWTVMKAAKREGVFIPHFCYHEALSVAGVCRFCMVRVEGRPKLEIACNLVASDGMVVETASEDVKEAHKWGLELHLVNHPLDCPVCDQAGECELQDYYMSVGKYESKMKRPKVLKPKAQDVGSQLVLDTERCILCSRCVRFEEEVTKTNGLGIFSRGDRAIVSIYGEEKLDHKYQENIVDICPVGAFTSKEFRFKQRVWFLKRKKTICTGCSTGCHVDVHGKPEAGRYYRVKPRESETNGHWMCDEGRHIYAYMNPEERLAVSYVPGEAGDRRQKASTDVAIDYLGKKLAGAGADGAALLVSASYTNEEYEALFGYFVDKLGIKKVYQWRAAEEDRDAFDGMLLRGDRNANTAGLLAALEKRGLGRPVGNEFEACLVSKPGLLVALAPENPVANPDYKGDLAKLAELPFVSVWSSSYLPEEVETIGHILPLKVSVEKVGTFTNANGKTGSLEEAYSPAIASALDVEEVVGKLIESTVT